MGRLLFALLAALTALLPVAATASGAVPRPPATPVPAPVFLSQGWQFAADPGDLGEAFGWPSGKEGRAWSAVNVPSVFDPQPLASQFKGTVGWYRITFAGPPTAPGRGWALRFEQVRRTARVWLNGALIGSHRDPYTPFELPAKGLLPGKPNTLVVRVDNRKQPQPREGWWNWGGIPRPVSLVARGPVVLHDVGLLPRRICAAGKCAWSVLVDGWLVSRSAHPQRPSVTVRLRSPTGTISQGSSPRRRVLKGERLRVRFVVPIKGSAAVWSPASPALYDTTVATHLGNQVVQLDNPRIGLRTVDVKNGLLQLNGRTMDLRGASIQEDMLGRGPALTDADMNTIVSELKAVGANVTRSHYLLNERLLDKLDAAGILVWQQAPVYHRDALLKTPAQRSYELGVLRNTILSARNHPSVITDSVANELSPTPDARAHRTTGEWLREAAKVARDLNPGVPVSVDLLSYPRIPRQSTYDAFDMIGINSYYGWYVGKRNRSTANLSDLGPYLTDMHAKYPTKAIVMTEFGAEATEAGAADVKQTYAFQQAYINRNLATVDRLGFMSGAIYWTLREFAVKPHWDGGAHPALRDSLHHKGLIAYDGKVKPAWNTARTDFLQTPLYRPDALTLARTRLSHSPSIFTSGLLVTGALVLLFALLALDAWCLRDIWRAMRPEPTPPGDVVPLRNVA